MDQISIVVPVYNVENYLSYCVESLRQQTYKNIEIILVDDGSTDSSGEICDQYAREDDRIKVLHIENGGLSNARNTGVKESSTDWIVFIDSDDYYDHRAIEYLVELRDKYRVDLVATPVIEVRNYENSDFLGDFREKYSGKLDRRTALEQMFYGNYVGTHSGGKLYKKEILLRFPYPNGMLYEDLALAYEHIAFCENIAVSDLNLYKYYRRPGSIVNSKYSDRLLDFYKAMEWNRSYVERDYSGDRDMRRALNVRYVFNGLHIVHAMLSSDMYAEVNKIRKEYIQYFKDVIPNSNVTRKNKLKYILFLVSAKLYKKVRGKMG
ncbi:MULTISPECIES: glycosyltransferase family 2 protein [Streptococcus]|jgi:putative glycosyltransferase|uniref:glycosyltransferase family 2 protein n=1 Tax=Streptococcus TaxID=1301 RepID=UPI001F2F1817|nr:MULTISPECIES: glycosyltransferase family 2 protein [Streptococcus]